MEIGKKENKVVIKVDLTQDELQVLSQASQLVYAIVVASTHIPFSKGEQTQFVINYEDGGKSTYSISELCSTAMVLDDFEVCKGNEFYIEAPLDNEPIEWYNVMGGSLRGHCLL